MRMLQLDNLYLIVYVCDLTYATLNSEAEQKQVDIVNTNMLMTNI